MENRESLCKPGSDATLIFACSGAADVGEIADRAARKLSKGGFGRMFCLVGIAGRVSPILKTTEDSARILAIDGCDLDCARNCLELADFRNFVHIRLNDLGLEKGRSPVTEQVVQTVADMISRNL